MSDENIKDKIKRDAIERAKREGVSRSNLFLDDKIYKAGEFINARKQKIPLKKDSYMVFVDDDPLYNWSHYCRYFLYDVLTGEFIKQVEARFPPYMMEIPISYKPFSQPVSHPTSSEGLRTSQPGKNLLASVPSDGNRYALLFSGASNYRHVNDLQYLYTVLVHRFNYSQDNIYVLNYDGTWRYSCFPPVQDKFPILDTKYNMPVDGAGTRRELNNAFDELKRRLKPNDMLFIHTNNHGDGPLHPLPVSTLNPVEVFLCMYSKEDLVDDYSASEFGEKLCELPKINGLMVMMEQCHSGGFSDYVMANSPATNTCFMAACQINQLSMGGNNFDPFTFEWTKSASGYILQKIKHNDILFSFQNPASVQDAFDSANNEVIVYNNNPVIEENPFGCGARMFLGIPKNNYPIMSLTH
jgi:hypothetical protein